mgnify:FL=1
MLLEVKNLTKSFNEKEVLKGVSFSASSGSALGLLGRNGAGKTTTIRIIMQLFAPNSGETLVDGNPINIREINIGYMPEERGLYPKKKILEQLIYFAELKGTDRATALARANKYLERLSMQEYQNAKLMTLSKGNQQKIQLIATLMCDPDIVILDEPFSGLDPVNAMLLKDVVRELIAEGKIVLFSSHQMNYIEEFCDSIVILNEGKIAVSGTIKDIKRSYTHNKVNVFTAEQDKASELLAKADYVDSFENTETGVLVALKPDVDKNVLIQSLIDEKIQFDGVAVYEPSLNDIFVDYTEGNSEGGDAE